MNSQVPSYATYPSLRDRGVLISGGATGIGAAFVEHFANQGARVAFLDIDAQGAQQLASRLDKAAHRPAFVQCDVTDLRALARGIDEARASVGAISVLVNNAANDVRHTLAGIDESTFGHNVAVNLRHQVFATRAVVPDMRELGGGSIICLGSIGWIKKTSGYPLYAMAKAAVWGFVNGVVRELGQQNIRINILVPGWVMTEKQRRLWVDAEGEAEIARMQCMRGYLMAEDLARTALFLAADDSHMCTGQNFIVDGGWV